MRAALAELPGPRHRRPGAPKSLVSARIAAVGRGWGIASASGILERLGGASEFRVGDRARAGDLGVTSGGWLESSGVLGGWWCRCCVGCCSLCWWRVPWLRAARRRYAVGTFFLAVMAVVSVASVPLLLLRWESR
jgi:hypothetical protein